MQSNKRQQWQRNSIYLQPTNNNINTKIKQKKPSCESLAFSLWTQPEIKKKMSKTRSLS